MKSKTRTIFEYGFIFLAVILFLVGFWIGDKIGDILLGSSAVAGIIAVIFMMTEDIKPNERSEEISEIVEERGETIETEDNIKNFLNSIELKGGQKSKI